MTTGPKGRGGELDPQAEAALRAFRREDDMPPEAQARVWARLAAATANDGTWSKGNVPRRRYEWAWATLALASAAALLLAARAGVLGPLGGRAGGEAAAYTERQAAATEPVRAAGAGETGPIDHVPNDMVQETDDRPTEVAAPEAVVSAPGRASEAKSEPRPRPEASSPRPPAEAPGSARGEASARQDGETADANSLAQEAEALARAQAAIQRGGADEALALLAAYAQQFPRGALREEHDALRALALCATDRAADGRAAAQVFLGAHGGSALAERVRQGCAEE